MQKLLQRLSVFFKKHPEWKITLPLFLVLFFANVTFRSTDFKRFHIWHSIFTYLMYLSVGIALLRTSYRYKRVVWANIILIGCIIAALELFFFFKLDMPYRHNISFSTQKLKNNPMLAQMGYLPKAPNTVIPEVKMKGEDTLFYVNYSIDSAYRRIVPGRDSIKKDYALFFGCSVTYGYGVNDDETLPYFFQEKSDRYHSYSYAFNGYGTQNMLAHLEREGIRAEVPEQSGIAIYLFIWHHVLRAIGDMNTYSWGWRLPYYASTSEGIERKGNFADDRWLVSTFYEWVCQSNIVKYLQLQFPLKITDKHFDLAADIILKSKKLYQQKFGNNDFYVVVFPGEFDQFRPEQKAYFLEQLSERGIQYKVYQDLYPIDDDHHVPEDPHPNGRAYEKVARQLIQDFDSLSVSKIGQ